MLLRKAVLQYNRPLNSIQYTFISEKHSTTPVAKRRRSGPANAESISPGAPSSSATTTPKPAAGGAVGGAPGGGGGGRTPGPATTPRTPAHVPLSERQQLALLKKMDETEHKDGAGEQLRDLHRCDLQLKVTDYSCWPLGVLHPLQVSCACCLLQYGISRVPLLNRVTGSRFV